MNCKKIIEAVKETFKETGICFKEKEIFKEGGETTLKIVGQFNVDGTDAVIYFLANSHDVLQISYMISKVANKNKVLSILNAFNRETSAKAYMYNSSIYVDYNYMLDGLDAIKGVIMLTKMRTFYGEYKSYYDSIKRYLKPKEENNSNPKEEFIS